jgi:hypothetical protein
LIAAVTFLPSRCLATIGEDIYGHTGEWEGFMKYGDEMGSGATIYISRFLKVGRGIQKLIARN